MAACLASNQVVRVRVPYRALKAGGRRFESDRGVGAAAFGLRDGGAAASGLQRRVAQLVERLPILFGRPRPGRGFLTPAEKVRHLPPDPSYSGFV